jgi:hypothetical protein
MYIEDLAKACLKVWEELEKARAAGHVELALSILSHLREMTAPLDDATDDGERFYARLLDQTGDLLRKGLLPTAGRPLKAVEWTLREDAGDQEFIQMLKRMSETPSDSMGES